MAWEVHVVINYIWLWYFSYCYWNLQWLSNFPCICGYFQNQTTLLQILTLPRVTFLDPSSQCHAWCWPALLPEGSGDLGWAGRMGDKRTPLPSSEPLSLCPGEILPPQATSPRFSLTCHRAPVQLRMQAHIPGWDSGNTNWEAPTAVGDCQLLAHPGSRLAPTKSVLFFNKKKTISYLKINTGLICKYILFKLRNTLYLNQ